jgi:hypothetical protein
MSGNIAFACFNEKARNMRRRRSAFTNALLAACAANLLMCSFESSWATAADLPLYDSRVADLVTDARFPGSSAVILIDRKIHTWSFDETVIEHARAIKILTGEGIDRFGDYVSDVYLVKVVDCRVEATVVSPRGERRPVEKSQIRRMAIGSSGYQYRAALPGLEIGSIIEIVETLRTEHRITWGEWDFSSRVPTLRSELQFKVPLGALVSFTFTPKNNTVSKSSEKGRKYETHTLTTEMVSPYVDEKYMPQSAIGNPTVHYRIRQITIEEYLRFFEIAHDAQLAQYIEENEIPWELPLVAANWSEIAEAFSEYFSAETWKDDAEADSYRSALRTMVRELPPRDTLGVAGALEGVLGEFRRRFQPTIHEFYYRNPEQSAELGEGDAFEAAYVLKRMFEQRGIESTVVLAGDVEHGMLDERNPDPFSLNRALLMIEWRGARHWVDPSAPECGVDQVPWECQGVRALWLKSDEKHSFITTPLDAASANVVSREMDLRIDDAGHVTGRSRIRLTGQPLMEIRRRFASGGRSTDADNLRDVLGELHPGDFELDSLSIDVDVKDTIAASFCVAKRNFGIRAGDVLQIEFSGWFDARELEAFESESRRFEIMFPYPVSWTLTSRIALPPNYLIEQLPGFVTNESSWFSYKRSCREDGGAIVLRRTFTITAPRVEAQEYGEAKQALETIQKIDREVIVLKRSS